MNMQSMNTPNLPTAKYNVKFSGNTIETTVTNKASVVDNWIREIQSIYYGNRIIMGLDCEWRPPDIWGLFNKVATLQLCVNNKCLVIQLCYLDIIPNSLQSFLNDPNVTAVGVEVDEDVSRLRNEYGLNCCSTADIRELASKRWCLLSIFGRKPGLKDLARLVMGLSMEKPRHVCKSDWQARVLSLEQIRYACIDAYASYRIGHKLLVG